MLTAADTAFITALGRQLEAARGLPSTDGPTCGHRHPSEGVHCDLRAGHTVLHHGQGHRWGSPDLAICTPDDRPCPGCASRCGQCREEALD